MPILLTLYSFFNIIIAADNPAIKKQEDKIMAFITEILEMVQNILVYVKEAEAAGIIEIVKNSLEAIFAGMPMPL